MGIQSLIGDVKSQVGNNIKSFLDGAYAAASGIADKVGTYVANIWSGGFAGLSDFEALKSAVTSYSNNVKDIVANYDATADLDQTIKGSTNEAVKEFVVSTKQLLQAYVALVEKWNTELDDIYEKYKSGDTSLAQNVSQDASDVQGAAQNVDIG